MEHSPDLVQRLLALYEAMGSGSAEAVDAFYSLSDGSVFIGTDESEFWTDSAKHNADVRPYFDGSHGRVRIAAGEVVALSSGETGWTVDRPAFHLPDGTKLDIRLTLIWRRQGDSWRVVHSHASIGGAG